MKISRMRRQSWFLVPLVLLFFAIGFGSGIAWSRRPTPTSTPTITPTASHTSTETPTPSATPSPNSTPTSTATDTPTTTGTHTPDHSATPSSTPTITLTPSRTPTITPTPVVQGRVLVQSNCRYGPGSAYLYEWGLFPKNRVTLLGRNQDSTWVYVDPWTYMDFCWVKTEFLEIISGDVSGLPQIRTLLPYTEFYWPPRNVRASRLEGGEVMVNWDLVPMSLDDNRGYLIEAWVCQEGQLLFKPLHFWNPPAVILDEPGCLQPSSARIYTAEKHGYTEWVGIPWPPQITPVPSETPSKD